METETRRIQLDRWSVTSARSFDEIVAGLNAAIGHPGTKTLFAGAGNKSNGTARIERFVIGNPLMKEMVKHVPDAASYAPLTILVVEEDHAVRLSYDTMASLLTAYGSAEASKVARDLDKEIESLLMEIATGKDGIGLA